ncbi:hypothetical protein FUA48_15215 [Flavobacterium alkalisoli]|uniref:DUF4870 domain-containing protein n=1 Tax=Flavobacterium alkalisoli TaxID=2602769 RepID=A0A5B9G1G7_9FLAO|nr:hypothetical protein [Flavobacterium alkalisoli]QEE50877.1 hypothetical protein FUA48_15215 [Flavobacterium alkalisoli]
MNTENNNGKTIAIISYLTIIGTIIAIVQNSETKSPFASFHIRQALGLILTFLALGYPIGYFDSWMVSSAFYLFFFILWVFGFLGAIQGQMALAPIVGPFFQKLFKGL